MAKTQALICPYCGDLQPPAQRCRTCAGFLDPLSRQATLNAMGPWSYRDPDRPFQPGCSYTTMVRLIDAGRVTKNTIVRGPSTRQLWTVAKRAPGIAHLLGYCHNCNTRVDPNDFGCSKCGEPFGAYLDRNHLGLPEIHPLPGEPDGRDDDLAAAYAGASASPLPWSPRRGSNGGLSSFASDDELRGDSRSASDLPAAPASSSGNGNGAAAQDSGMAEGDATSPSAPPSGRSPEAVFDAPSDRRRDEPGALSPDILLTSPAVRSMQRRLASQERTIRVLAVLLTVAIISVAFLLVLGSSLNRQLRDQGESPERATEVERPSSPANGEAEAEADSAPDAPAPDVAADQPAERDDASEDSKSPVPPAEPDLARVNELIAIGKDESRSETDRLAAYDEARGRLQLLLEREEWSDETRRELRSLLTEVEQAIDRLELGRFFSGMEDPG